MVKRYELSESWGVPELSQYDHGEWVSFEDYEKVADKARERLREAAAVYRLYNATQQPDGNLVDEQTLQELSDLING